MRSLISVCSIAVLLCVCGGCTRATRAKAWMEKGAELNHLGHHKEALEAFDKVIAIDPYYAAAWKNKAGVLFFWGYPKEAEEAMRKAREFGVLLY